MLSVVAVHSGKISAKSNHGNIDENFQSLLALYTGFESISMDCI